MLVPPLPRDCPGGPERTERVFRALPAGRDRGGPTCFLCAFKGGEIDLQGEHQGNFECSRLSAATTPVGFPSARGSAPRHLERSRLTAAKSTRPRLTSQRNRKAQGALWTLRFRHANSWDLRWARSRSLASRICAQVSPGATRTRTTRRRLSTRLCDFDGGFDVDITLDRAGSHHRRG